MAGLLNRLRDYFPTTVYTGNSLIFISEETRVELTEHACGDLSGAATVPVIRVRLFAKGPAGDFEPGHYEDFQLADISELAGEIEKFVQFAVGRTIRE